MDEFDVIIVGAGPAGATAAYLLAKAGLQVLVIERGPYPGSKNVSGGLIYSRIYHEIYPNFWETAPVERAIAGHGIVFLSEDASTTVDFRSQKGLNPPYNAFSVLRAKFDPWLAEQAEAAGAMILTGFRVDELVLEGQRVVGVKAGGDELRANVVVVAEGTRSQLLKQAGLRQDFQAKDVSLGIKEVIALPPETITDRFQCSSDADGMAYTLVGNTGGLEGGGFLYTNRDTLSLGVVIKISALYASKRQPHTVLEQFKAHPFIERLIKGGKLVEYSAQAVHRGGLHLMPRLYGDGYVVVGSAARLILNNIMTMRGMDVAVASAAAAAKAIIDAKEKGDFSAVNLAGYEDYFKQTSVYQDMVTFKDTYPLLENKRLFEVYPDLAGAVMEDMFTVDTKPAEKLYASLRKNMAGNISRLELLKDAYQIARGLVL